MALKARDSRGWPAITSCVLLSTLLCKSTHKWLTLSRGRGRGKVTEVVVVSEQVPVQRPVRAFLFDHGQSGLLAALHR